MGGVGVGCVTVELQDAKIREAAVIDRNVRMDGDYG